jgi:hypothetical protein
VGNGSNDDDDDEDDEVGEVDGRAEAEAVMIDKGRGRE